MIAQIVEAVRGALENEMASSVAIIGVVMGVGGWLLFQLRAIPMLVCRLIVSQVTLEIEISSAQPTFHLLELWLAGHPMMKRARRVTTVSSWAEDREEQEHALTIGSGVHVFWRGRRLWWLHRSSQQKPPSGASGPPVAETGGAGVMLHTMVVRTFGRDPKVLSEFLADVRRGRDAQDVLPVFVWERGYYRLAARKIKRDLRTVHLAKGAKERLLADLQRFLAAREWYADRGVPWRRGILLEGPPGAGKTSLIFALASALDKPVYVINPSTLQDDAELQSAVNGARGLLVIEDVDSMEAAGDRAAPRGGPETVLMMPGKGLTASGLLNAIDGLASQDGRILIITTNHPERLDAALLRPGRIDVREHLGLAGAEVATSMFSAFFPRADARPFVRSLDLPMAPAAIQNRLLAMAAASDRAAELSSAA